MQSRHRLPPRPRKPARWAGAALVVLGLCGLAQPAPVQAQAPPERLLLAIEAARALAGQDPEEGRARLAQLRREAEDLHRADVRLRIDEIDCRVLSDTDGEQARAVAQGGVAWAAGRPLDAPAQSAMARARACGAGALLDVGKQAEGEQELNDVLQAAEGRPALAAGRAMALLERGLHRSRRGELITGQEDLLAACSILSDLGLPADLELCQYHLANHYKRTGDTEEAMRLMEPLLVSARQRGATADIGVYAYGLGQLYYVRKDPLRALESFRESLAIAEAARDTLGIAYGEHSIAQTLLNKGSPGDALPHAERALRMLPPDGDVLQFLRTTILKANALNGLHQAMAALDALRQTEPDVRKLRDDAMKSDWLAAMAEAQGQLGHWREAYQALAEWRTVDAGLQAQLRSEQSARLRMQFNREKDAAEVALLRQSNEQGQRLRNVQAVALVLFVLLLLVAVGYAVRKVRQMRRLQRLALHDELTGLPNRRAVLAHAEQQLRHARRLGRSLGVLMIDVDNFKRINDGHGHKTGDEVLRALAQLLSASLRANDRLGRLGGEEFLVVVPDAEPDHVQAIAERMRGSIAAKPCTTSAGPLAVTVSIGVACGGEAMEALDALIARADEALYEAKRRGRNAVHVALLRPQAAA